MSAETTSRAAEGAADAWFASLSDRDQEWIDISEAFIAGAEWAEGQYRALVDAARNVAEYGDSSLDELFLAVEALESRDNKVAPPSDGVLIHRRVVQRISSEGIVDPWPSPEGGTPDA